MFAPPRRRRWWRRFTYRVVEVRPDEYPSHVATTTTAFFATPLGVWREARRKASA